MSKLNSVGIQDFWSFLLKIAIFVAGGAAHLHCAQQLFNKLQEETFSSDTKGKNPIE